MEPTTARPTEPRTTVLQLGRLQLKGAAALVALLVIVAGIVALVIWRGLPRWPIMVAAALWIGFISYWSAVAKHAAPTRSSESTASRRTHVRLMNAAFVLLFFGFGTPLGRRFLPDSIVLVAIGLAIQCGSGALGVWARRHLGRNWSGAITVAENHELVRSGPYRVLRHPIYTAMIGMFVGSAIAIGEWHSLIGALLIMIAYARKIPMEEQSLRGVFGSAYDDYKKGSWAIIPGVL
jgi:protein-S-isoprenylcysteine O-methyltransferase Ste14